MQYEELLTRAQAHAREFLASLPDRRVNARCADPSTHDVAQLEEEGLDPLAVIDHLASVIAQGSVATPGPR